MSDASSWPLSLLQVGDVLTKCSAVVLKAGKVSTAAPCTGILRSGRGAGHTAAVSKQHVRCVAASTRCTAGFLYAGLTSLAGLLQPASVPSLAVLNQVASAMLIQAAACRCCRLSPRAGGSV